MSRKGGSLKQRTLWSATDTDRSNWWQYGAFIALGAAILVGILCLVVYAGMRGDQSGADSLRVGNYALRALLLIVPIAIYPITRIRAARKAMSELAAFQAPLGMLRTTRQALSDISIMSGRPMPDLWVFQSDSLNAVASREKTRDRVAVSTAFAALPVEEQRAGIAMILGRNMLKLESILLGGKYGIPTNKSGATCTLRDLNEPTLRPKIVGSWLEAAAAGDRKALMMTRDPAPMVTLLKRLAAADTMLPVRSLEAAYGCLAWPFWKAAGGTQATVDQSLPEKARVAIATLIPNGTGAAEFPEEARLGRLRSVLPAAEQDVRDPQPISAPVDLGALQDEPSNPAHSDAPGMPGLAFALSGTMGAPAAGVAAPPAPPPAAGRISRQCPACGANNVADNRSCICCGRSLSGPAAVGRG